MIVVTVLGLVALLGVTVGVFFDYLLHDRYMAWWHGAKTGVQHGVDGFYQERDQ